MENNENQLVKLGIVKAETLERIKQAIPPEKSAPLNIKLQRIGKYLDGLFPAIAILFAITVFQSIAGDGWFFDPFKYVLTPLLVALMIGIVGFSAYHEPTQGQRDRAFLRYYLSTGKVEGFNESMRTPDQIQKLKRQVHEYALIAVGIIAILYVIDFVGYALSFGVIPLFNFVSTEVFLVATGVLLALYAKKEKPLVPSP